jgi:peptide/nickel transport system permease protein
MLTYIGRRLLQLPIILFGVTLLIFFMLTRLSPSQRLALYLRDEPDRGKTENLLKLYHLDDPIPVQYVRWLTATLKGDLGFSYTGHEPVTELLASALPVSLELALWSVLPILLVGVQLGVTAAVNQNKPLDHIARVFSIIGWSFPTFVFGLLVLMIFYAELKWFPPERLSDWATRIVEGGTFVQFTHMNTFDAILNGRFDIFFDALRHMVLPIITLSYLNWALILRITRSSMLEALRQDYVTTARAKGIPENVVINKHVKRNAMIPVATVGGLTVIGLMSGVVITETIFNIHGLGWRFALAALRLDVVTVIGFTLFNAVVVVMGNLITDIVYAFLDPRVRYT